MAKPNVSEVIDIKDPLLSDNFEFLIANVPNQGAAGRDLRIQCKTAVKPGTTINEVLYELFGHVVVHAGRKEFSHELSIEYVENYEARITTIIEDWIEYIRETERQSGHFKKDYATDGEFIFYDQEGNSTRKFKIVNIWPKGVDDLQFNEAAEGLPVNATFAYDHYVRTA